MTQEKIETFVDEAKTAELNDEYGPGNERWELRPLSELIEPVLGKTPKRSEEEYWSGDIQWASAKDISQSETRHIYDTAENMTEAGKEASNAKILPAGTVVVIARGATMGRVAQLGESMTFNQTCYGLDTTEELLDDYLYYAWQYVFGQVQAVSYGTVFDTITMKSFEDIEIPVPPLEIQEAIGEWLCSIDDKIESNVRETKQLEEVADEIYRGMFEEFVGYENMIDSEVGKIPEDFRAGKINDLLSLEYGDGLPQREREGEKYPVYGSSGVTGRHNESLIEGPGIIVGRKGTIGTVMLEMDNFWPIDTAFYVNPGEDDELLYLYHLLKNTPLSHLGSDSAVPGLNRNVAHDQEVAIPPRRKRLNFVEKVRPFHKQKNHLTEQTRILNSIRDLVLPQFLSGRITPGR
jgi:type I restriction enzyme S subunit